MENMVRKSEITKLNLEIITASTFMRFYCRQRGYMIDSGLIIVMDSYREAKTFMNQWESTGKAVIVDKVDKDISEICNYQAAVHLYSKYDDCKTVLDFLNKNSFMPILIIIGVVPDSLHDKCYCLRLKYQKNEFEQFWERFDDFCSIVIDHLDELEQQFVQLKNENFLKNYPVDQEFDQFFSFIVASGLAWRLFYMKKIQIQNTTKWFQMYLDRCQSIIEEMDYFDVEFDVKEVVRMLVTKNVIKNPDIMLNLCEKQDEEFWSKIKSGNVILYDSNYYYIPERFMENICEPLLNTMTFKQLKLAMVCSNMLRVNYTKGRNYTVKKQCVQNGQVVRLRFLKFIKNAFKTEDLLTLEDLKKYQDCESYIENSLPLQESYMDNSLSFDEASMENATWLNEFLC